MVTAACSLSCLGVILLVTFPLTPYATGTTSDTWNYKSPKHNITSGTRFFIYDVNPGEGFNLRRDVYIRAANLIRMMIDRGEDWVLVLPPWSHLYHWKNRYLKQEATPWKAFFDLNNMNKYIPVMEFEDFLALDGYNGIDHILYLQRHPDGFANGWVEKVEFGDCKKTMYHLGDDGRYHGYFWNIREAFAKQFSCVSVQGSASVLADFIRDNVNKAQSVFLPRLEAVTHITYGGLEFYKARRSLVFAKHLRTEGDKFRSAVLNSTDQEDLTKYNEDWMKQVPEDGSAKGGPYLGIHMRRGDFAYAHKETVPSIEEIGTEAAKVLQKYQLKDVYLSTDGNEGEVEELQSYLPAIMIHRYPRTKDIVAEYKDGGVAVIDQWVVAHARYFIGTCGSTFSFRIHEERDILGFHADTTYNCICGKQSPPEKCHPPTRWRVKF